MSCAGPGVGNATSSEKLKTLNIPAIFYLQILPVHRVAGLQFFLHDGNAMISGSCIALQLWVKIAHVAVACH